MANFFSTFIFSITILSPNIYLILYNHKPVFSLNNPVEKQAIDEMLEMPLSNVDGLISASKHAPFRPPEEITDVNMITEYRYGVDFWPSAN